MHDIVFKQVHVLYQSERIEKDYASPLLVAHRRDANLCNMLVHDKTNRISTQHSCTCDEGYFYCAGILKSDILVTCKKARYPTEVKKSCCLQYVVYLIRCSRCDVVVFVKETERSYMTEWIGTCRL